MYRRDARLQVDLVLEYLSTSIYLRIHRYFESFNKAMNSARNYIPNYFTYKVRTNEWDQEAQDYYKNHDTITYSLYHPNHEQ